MTARHERMKTTGLSGLRQHAWLLQQTTSLGTLRGLYVAGVARNGQRKVDPILLASSLRRSSSSISGCQTMISLQVDG